MTNSTVATNANIKFSISVTISDDFVTHVFQNYGPTFWHDTCQINVHGDDKKQWAIKIVDCDENLRIASYDMIVAGIKKLVREYVKGDYNDYNPIVALRDDDIVDFNFTDHIIQYSIYGDIVYG